MHDGVGHFRGLTPSESPLLFAPDRFSDIENLRIKHQAASASQSMTSDGSIEVNDFLDTIRSLSSQLHYLEEAANFVPTFQSLEREDDLTQMDVLDNFMGRTMTFSWQTGRRRLAFNAIT